MLWLCPKALWVGAIDVLDSIQQMHRPSRLSYGIRLVGLDNDGRGFSVNNTPMTASVPWKYGINGTADGTWSYDSGTGNLTLNTTTTTFGGCGPSLGEDTVPIIIDEEGAASSSVVLMIFNPGTDQAMYFGGSLNAYIDSGRNLYGTGWSTKPTNDKFHRPLFSTLAAEFCQPATNLNAGSM